MVAVAPVLLRISMVAQPSWVRHQSLITTKQAVAEALVVGEGVNVSVGVSDGVSVGVSVTAGVSVGVSDGVGVSEGGGAAAVRASDTAFSMAAVAV